MLNTASTLHLSAALQGAERKSPNTGRSGSTTNCSRVVIIPLDPLEVMKRERRGRPVVAEEKEWQFVNFVTDNPEVRSIEVTVFSKRGDAIEVALGHLNSPKLISVEID